MIKTNTFHKNGRRKARTRSMVAKFIYVATMFWAIATNWAAGSVTLPLHAKGAPQLG